MTDNAPTYREELFAQSRLLRDEASILVTRAEIWEAAAYKIEARLKLVEEGEAL